MSGRDEEEVLAAAHDLIDKHRHLIGCRVRVVRAVEFTGGFSRVAFQLARSLPEGERRFGGPHGGVTVCVSTSEIEPVADETFLCPVCRGQCEVPAPPIGEHLMPCQTCEGRGEVTVHGLVRWARGPEPSTGSEPEEEMPF